MRWKTLNKNSVTRVLKSIAAVSGIFILLLVVSIAGRVAGRVAIGEIQSVMAGEGLKPISEFLYIWSDESELKHRVSVVRSQNPYMQVLVGPDTYLHAIYNNKGEAFVESEATGVVGVYKSNHKLVVVSASDEDDESSITFTTDLDPLSFIEAACNVVGETGATITKEKQEDDYDKYTIKIVGKQAVKSVYMQTGDEEYANDSMEMLFDYVTEEVSDNAYLIIRVICNEGNSDGTGIVFGATCNMSFDGTEDGEYTSWAFDGYLAIPDWGLGDDWYNTPETDKEAWVELYQDTVASMADSLMEYMYTNNLLATDAETSSVTASSFIEADEDTQYSLIGMAMEDIVDYGAHITAAESDLYAAVKAYYDEVGADGVNLFQAVINVSMDKGWLIQDMVEGEQATSDEDVSSEDASSDTSSDTSGDTSSEEGN